MVWLRERFARSCGDAGSDIQYELFEGCEHEWVAQPGPQTDHAREIVKAFIARKVKLRNRTFMGTALLDGQQTGQRLGM
jgi:hypothetical protein